MGDGTIREKVSIPKQGCNCLAPITGPKLWMECGNNSLLGMEIVPIFFSRKKGPITNWQETISFLTLVDGIIPGFVSEARSLPGSNHQRSIVPFCQFVGIQGGPTQGGECISGIRIICLGNGFRIHRSLQSNNCGSNPELSKCSHTFFTIHCFNSLRSPYFICRLHSPLHPFHQHGRIGTPTQFIPKQ